MRLGPSIVAVALLVAAAPASAATWSKARPLVREQNVDPVTLHLAAAANGETAFVWIQGRLVQARTRSPAGRLGPVFTLRRMAHSNLGLPQIAIGPRGSIAAIWMENLAPHARGRVAVYLSVGSARGFGPARRVGTAISPEGGGGAGSEGGSAKIAIGADGTIAALWPTARSSLGTWWKTPRSASGVRGTIPAAAGRSDVHPGEVALGFDRHGTAFAGWTTIPTGPLGWDVGRVWTASRGARARGFGVAAAVSAHSTRAGTGAFGLHMSVGADGTVAAVWLEGDGLLSPVGSLAAAIKPAGAPFAAPQALSPGCEEADPDVAVSSRGRVLATWERSCPAGASTVAATGAPLLGAPEPMQVSGEFRDLAMADTGQAVYVFSPGAHASVRPPGGPFGAPHLIARSQFSTTPRVAIGGRLAVTGWQAPGGFYYSTLAL